MARPRLPILPHLTHDEIVARWRACRSGPEEAHWQALRLLTRPVAPPSAAEVAEAEGLSPSWVRSLIGRWNARGPDGLVDRRKSTNHGREKLAVDRRVDLWYALRHSPPDGGLWTGPKVVAYVRGRLGVAVAKSTGWRWLRAPGFSLQVPRHPRPPHPPTGGRGEYALSERVGRLRPEHPDEVVEVWAEDEARLSLKPGRSGGGGWSHEVPVALRLRLHPPGQRPEPGVGPAGGEYGLDGGRPGGVRPVGRPGRREAPGPARGQRRLACGEAAGLVLHRLPPCTPELQPIESLWPLLREAAANEGYDDLRALERPLIERCTWLMSYAEVVRGAVAFAWAAANG